MNFFGGPGRCLLLILGAVALAASAVVAQDTAGLSGQWTIDRAHSEFPAEIGFGASFMPATPVAPNSGGGGGRGRNRNNNRSTNPVYSRPDSQDDARRIQLLTDAVRTPAINLTIADAGASVTITVDGNSRTFHPNGKEESIALDQVPVATVTTRIEGGLVVLYHVAEGRDLRCTYWRSVSSPQLVVDAAFVERGAVDSVRRVYLPGTASTPAPVATAPPAPRSSAAGPAPTSGSEPAVDSRPDAELRGIKKLGLIVEDLSQQAASCGLTRDAIDAVASKSVTDAGLAVTHALTSEDNTYLYVNVMTTSASNGLCVSRYDVSLYTHTTAKLSYQSASALVQVQLAHAGSMSGGDAKTHADAVARGIKGYVDELAARVAAANK